MSMMSMGDKNKGGDPCSDNCQCHNHKVSDFIGVDGAIEAAINGVITSGYYWVNYGKGFNSTTIVSLEAMNKDNTAFKVVSFGFEGSHVYKLTDRVLGYFDTETEAFNPIFGVIRRVI